MARNTKSLSEKNLILLPRLNQNGRMVLPASMVDIYVAQNEFEGDKDPDKTQRVFNSKILRKNSGKIPFFREKSGILNFTERPQINKNVMCVQ